MPDPSPPPAASAAPASPARSKNPFAAFSMYYRGKAAVTAAAERVGQNAESADTAVVAALFTQFAAIYDTCTTAEALDKFMVQLADAMRARKVTIDALVLYGLQHKVATHLKITR